MCGIVGAFCFGDAKFKITKEYIEKMRDTMAHRGPDGAGTWISDDHKIGFGHRRLSIIDLSQEASQPMCNEDQTLWVTYNGEIYNHAEIRKELDHVGKHKWKTDHSDTEVILHAFEEWGIDCIQRFRGMFAIAVWDAKKKELWLIRDRMGIKPLYYSIHNNRIVFSSEIKALLKDPDQKRQVHEQAFYHFLSFLTTPAPQTLFDNIKKIPAGCWLRIESDSQFREHRYWDLWDHTQSLTNLSEDDISDKLREELRIAVKYRKISDVPVGTFLSGGIDSSINTVMFSEGEVSPVKTFSIGCLGEYRKYRNEFIYARQAAELVGADHHELYLSQDDLLSFLPQMIHLQDEPIADPVCVPTYYLSKLARDNKVKVCQVGEGSDELFWGYPDWKRMLDLQRYNNLPVPRFVKEMGLSLLRLSNRSDTYYYEYLRRSANGNAIFWGGADALTEQQKMHILSPRLRKEFSQYTSWEALKPIYTRFKEKAWETSHLNWMSFLDLNLRLPELLLMRVDKMAMGVGLETRVPFLDHKFVELAMSIPQAVKTKNGNLKYILKKTVRGYLPDRIIDRKKQGFNIPVYEWFFDRLGDKAREDMLDFCDHTDFFNKKGLMKIFNENRGHVNWYLLNFVLWWKEYIR